MPFDPADPVLAPEDLLANRDAFIVLDARPAVASGAETAFAHRQPAGGSNFEKDAAIDIIRQKYRFLFGDPEAVRRDL